MIIRAHASLEIDFIPTDSNNFKVLNNILL